MYTLTHTYIYIYILTHIYVYIHIYTYLYTYIYTFVFRNLCLWHQPQKGFVHWAVNENGELGGRIYVEGKCDVDISAGSTSPTASTCSIGDRLCLKRVVEILKVFTSDVLPKPGDSTT